VWNQAVARPGSPQIRRCGIPAWAPRTHFRSYRIEFQPEFGAQRRHADLKPLRHINKSEIVYVAPTPRKS